MLKIDAELVCHFYIVFRAVDQWSYVPQFSIGDKSISPTAMSTKCLGTPRIVNNKSLGVVANKDYGMTGHIQILRNLIIHRVKISSEMNPANKWCAPGDQ
ncbi:hypothetical protein CH92_21740 [Stutzerimonas stutzeri]|uniref:Uncharacterized protein n=1 Tax=Stutzerimonas stutzeri TaxID=316 RepID=W8RGP4_STUST|nr:hypothetical protein CH92_21740 [Stutzerimonas stutzeri]